jgi:hypothetical protein
LLNGELSTVSFVKSERHLLVSEKTPYKNEAKESHTHTMDRGVIYTTNNKWFASMKRKRESSFWTRDYHGGNEFFSIFSSSRELSLGAAYPPFPPIAVLACTVPAVVFSASVARL